MTTPRDTPADSRQANHKLDDLVVMAVCNARFAAANTVITRRGFSPMDAGSFPDRDRADGEGHAAGTAAVRAFLSHPALRGMSFDELRRAWQRLDETPKNRLGDTDRAVLAAGMDSVMTGVSTVLTGRGWSLAEPEGTGTYRSVTDDATGAAFAALRALANDDALSGIMVEWAEAAYARAFSPSGLTGRW